MKGRHRRTAKTFPSLHFISYIHMYSTASLAQTHFFTKLTSAPFECIFLGRFLQSLCGSTRLCVSGFTGLVILVSFQLVGTRLRHSIKTARHRSAFFYLPRASTSYLTCKTQRNCNCVGVCGAVTWSGSNPCERLAYSSKGSERLPTSTYTIIYAAQSRLHIISCNV